MVPLSDTCYRFNNRLFNAGVGGRVPGDVQEDGRDARAVCQPPRGAPRLQERPQPPHLPRVREGTQRARKEQEGKARR